LRAMGLVHTDARGKVISWRAMLWPTGGTAAIFLHPEATDADRRKVDDVVRMLISNPAYGVAKAYRGPELAALGGFLGAHVVLEARPSFTFTRAMDAAEIVGKHTGGTHGWNPRRPELRAAFIVRGPKIRKHVNLGIVRLLDVAPTVARVLGIDMGKVEGRVIGEAFEREPVPAGARRRP